MDLELCRGCGKNIKKEESPVLNLFENNNRYLLHRIKILTNVTLKSIRNLPKFVCTDCQNKINDAYNFRKSFLQTQKYFRERIKLKNPLEVSTTKNFHEIPLEFNTNQTEISNLEIKSDHTNNELIAQSNNEIENPLKLFGAATSIGHAPIFPLVENINDTEFNGTESHQQNTQSDIENFLANKLSKRRGTKKNVKLRHKQKVIEEKEKHEGEDAEDKKSATFKLRKKNKNVCEKSAKFYVCDQCGNHFTTHHYFIIHQRRHTGEKPYTCEICTKKFFTDSELMRHMRKHTGEKPFGCRFCLRRFSDCSTRLKHERTHTNERPFSCTYCAKSFTTSYILKNHMLIHTGEKLFSCELCNRSFSRQTHLVVHNRSLLHKQAEEKSKRKACTN